MIVNKSVIFWKINKLHKLRVLSICQTYTARLMDTRLALVLSIKSISIDNSNSARTTSPGLAWQP
jgi:hypothetical protein